MIRDPQDPSFSPVSGYELYQLCDSTDLIFNAAVIIGPGYSRQIYVFATAETDDQRTDVHYRPGRACWGIALGSAMFTKLAETLASQVVLQVGFGCMVGTSKFGILTAVRIAPLAERPSLRSPAISSRCCSSYRITGDVGFTLVRHCGGS
jgi:hypothetical protein